MIGINQEADASFGSAEPLSVAALTHSIQQCLEGTFPQLYVKGEIQNFKLQSSGHCYFSLNDAEAQIQAVMFRGSATALKFAPKNGDQVAIKGSLSVYPPRGGYQIIVKEMVPTGVGELLLKLHALKEKLQKLGWFDPQRKKRIPPLPNRIGVVTSPTGAVIQDIIHVLSRRYPAFHLILNPVKVQGERAAEEIAQAIRDFNRYELADVLIVGRGGGSLEDLFAFNEECVAQAIFESKIPIISAVGHETDFTIADFVADLRAPTPSAAAEMVIKDASELLRYTVLCKKKLTATLLTQIKHYKETLQTIKRMPQLASVETIFGRRWQKLDDLVNRLDRAVLTRLDRERASQKNRTQALRAIQPLAVLKRIQDSLQAEMKRLSMAWSLYTQEKVRAVDQIEKRFTQRINSLLAEKRAQAPQLARFSRGIGAVLKRHKERLELVQSNLYALSPKQVVARGFAILRDADSGKCITVVEALHDGQKISAELSDGMVTIQIKGVECG
jgi:exodeoxyribonuclease VII, large subunit